MTPTEEFANKLGKLIKSTKLDPAIKTGVLLGAVLDLAEETKQSFTSLMRKLAAMYVKR